jgi:hypothetical protein
MSVTPEAAASALAEASEARRRVGRLQGYRGIAPHVIVWGAIWIVANTVNDLLPGHEGPVWLALVVPGIAASMVLGARTGRRWLEPGESTAGQSARWALASLALFAYFACVLSVMAPVSGAQVGTYISFTFAAAYVFLGIFSGWKIALLGVAMGAALLAGFFSGLPHMQTLGGCVAGTAMILGGVWMRRA